MGRESSEFLKDAFKKGLTDHEAICKHIHEEISKIDLKLAEADQARIKKIKLTAILRDLGDESIKRRRLTPETIQIELDEDSEESQKIRYKICCMIEKHGSLTNRDIIQEVGDYQQDAKVIRAIKFLGERGVVKRDETPERHIIPGPNWDDREPNS